jgi:glycosyltransferase involved in cell wall biosynthesis
MDLFVFPSNTDTFGNAVQEALSSGVPAVVTSKGGPKHIVRSGKTGIVASNDREFMRAVLSLMSMKDLRKVMSGAARAYACSASWDRVFDGLFQDYAVACQEPVELPAAS